MSNQSIPTNFDSRLGIKGDCLDLSSLPPEALNAIRAIIFVVKEYDLIEAEEPQIKDNKRIYSDIDAPAIDEQSDERFGVDLICAAQAALDFANK